MKRQTNLMIGLVMWSSVAVAAPGSKTTSERNAVGRGVVERLLNGEVGHFNAFGRRYEAGVERVRRHAQWTLGAPSLRFAGTDWNPITAERREPGQVGRFEGQDVPGLLGQLETLGRPTHVFATPSASSTRTTLDGKGGYRISRRAVDSSAEGNALDWKKNPLQSQLAAFRQRKKASTSYTTVRGTPLADGSVTEVTRSAERRLDKVDFGQDVEHRIYTKTVTTGAPGGTMKGQTTTVDRAYVHRLGASILVGTTKNVTPYEGPAAVR